MALGKWGVVLFSLLVLSGEAGPVTATVLTLSNGWQASWTDPNLTLAWDKDNSVLTKNVTFKDLSAISITFENTMNPPVPGIFFTVKDSAKNKTNVDWDDFLFKLNDFVKVGTDRGLHPSYTHFHTQRAGAALETKPLTFQSGGDRQLPSQNFIVLGLGSPVKIGDSLTANNFKIHATDSTKFEFTEQPSPAIPEPSVVAFFSFGALIILGFCRRRRHCRVSGS